MAWWCKEPRSSIIMELAWIVQNHDDVIKWRYFPGYWSFVWGIHRLLVNSPHKGQWHGALMFSLIYACWISGWVNNCESGDLTRHCTHFDIIVMCSSFSILAVIFKHILMFHSEAKIKWHLNQNTKVFFKNNLKMSAKCWPFCSGYKMLNTLFCSTKCHTMSMPRRDVILFKVVQQAVWASRWPSTLKVW